MNHSNAQHALISEQEYLANEQVSEIKHEYVAGYVYAMTGASMNHERIAANILSEFRFHLKNSSCEVFGSNIQVKTATGKYRYPDCSVICDKTPTNDLMTKTPVILVEVLSRSTRKTDKQIKRLEYINIPSLQEYVLIEQDNVEVTVYRKNLNWQSTHYFLGDDVLFEPINLTLSVQEIYHKVLNQDMSEWLERLEDQG